jgi:hypothetical protein
MSFESGAVLVKSLLTGGRTFGIWNNTEIFSVRFSPISNFPSQVNCSSPFSVVSEFEYELTNIVLQPEHEPLSTTIL